MEVPWIIRVILKVLLLLSMQLGVYALVLCQAPCECKFDDDVSGNSAVCPINKYTTVYANWSKSHRTHFRPELTIKCEGIKYFTCFDFPQFDITHYQMRVNSCPTRLLNCVNSNYRLPTATIDKLETENLFGNFTEEAFQGLSSVRDLKISLRDGDPLPLSAIKSVAKNNDVTVTIKGGNPELTPSIFADIPVLKEFTLENNNINNFLEDSLSGLSCTKLQIMGNLFERLNPETFKGINYLEELNLEGNKLKYITAGAFASESIKILQLQKNILENLPNGFLDGLTNLQKVQVLSNKVDLNLDGYVFSDLPPSIEFIELYGSKLHYLTDTLFSKSTYIKILMMHETKIIQLPDKIFWDLVSLTHLNLSGNNIRHLTKVLFSRLTKLQSLNMNFNQITTLADNQFSFSLNLQQLYLDQNRISNINVTSFNGTNLQMVSLFGNGIRKVNGDTAIAWKNVNVLRLGGNKLESFEHIIYRLTNLTEADFSRNEIKTIRENKTYFMSAKLLLDLRRNHISTIIKDPAVVKKSLSGGKIALYLSNNPLVCDCALATVFHEWNKEGLVRRFEDVHCFDGQAISEINPFILCNKKLALIATVGTSLIGGLVLFLLFISIVSNRKAIWNYILDILPKKKFNKTVEIEMGSQEAKPYDIFISFAHQDEKFVAEELLPKLENEFGYKVCVHYRDWVVGELITDQIQESVETSKMTVIILTEHFLMSEWSYLEFRAAHNLSVEEGKQRVILILLDEAVSRDERLSSDLKAYVSINTYLLWDDHRFWHRLRKALPKPETKSDKPKMWNFGSSLKLQIESRIQ